MRDEGVFLPKLLVLLLLRPGLVGEAGAFKEVELGADLGECGFEVAAGRVGVWLPLVAGGPPIGGGGGKPNEDAGKAPGW